MNRKNEPHRGNGWSVVPWVALSCTLVNAQTIPDPPAPDMVPLVVSALRFPQEEASVTSAVTVLDPEELTQAGLFQLQDALNLSPGVISTSTAGQTGAVGSIFIRGSRTIDSQVVVDGLRFSDSNSPMGNLLASGRTFTVGRLEVLRGPHGAIYGGNSTGGVLWMETPRGCGPHTGSLMTEAGSFDSLASYARFQGSENSFSYHVSGGYEETANDGPAMDFHQASKAMRLENQINDRMTIGGTFRMVDSYYNNMGSSDDHFDAMIGTLYANIVLSDYWTSRIHAGGLSDAYDSDSTWGNFGTDAESYAASIDNEIVLAEGLRMLAGGFYQITGFQNTIGVDDTRSRFGGHAVLEWDSSDQCTHHAALRWEDFDEFGSEWTWRLGSLWRAMNNGPVFRGGIGTSFRPPSFLDLYGSNFGAGNTALDPESALGWDLGVSQAIGDHHEWEFTWFRNLISDTILSSPTPPVNLPGTEATDGCEIGIRGEWTEPSISYRLAWTWLRQSLRDQPRNAVNAMVEWRPEEDWLFGVGASHLSARSWGGDPLGGYIVTRVFGSYQITENLRIHARIENALDEEYDLSSYTFGGSSSVTPAAGMGVYAGLSMDW